MKSKKGFALSVLLVFFICGVTIPLFMTNHTKVKADTITDLTGTTWIFNSTIMTRSNGYYNINFSNNNTTYNVLYWTYLDDDDFFALYYDNTNVYYNSGGADGWNSENYKTIQITGGSDAINPSLITWIQNNASLQGYTPPTPTGTQITHKYWALGSTVPMINDSEYSDDDIEYTILFNEQRRQYDETEQIGLVFRGKTTSDPRVYVWSINGDGINLLYMNDSSDNNYLDNVMWLEFNIGDYIDTNLYNFMDLQGYWFDDAEAYISGTAQGWVEGIEHGRALGQADGVEYTGLITGIFNGLGNILSIQVFPNITIGLLIGLPLLLGAFIIIIKILRG